MLVTTVRDEFQAEVEGEAAQSEHPADAGGLIIQCVSPTKADKNAGQDYDNESESFSPDGRSLNPLVAAAQRLRDVDLRTLHRSAPPSGPAFDGQSSSQLIFD